MIFVFFSILILVKSARGGARTSDRGSVSDANSDLTTDQFSLPAFLFQIPTDIFAGSWDWSVNQIWSPINSHCLHFWTILVQSIPIGHRSLCLYQLHYRCKHESPLGEVSEVPLRMEQGILVQSRPIGHKSPINSRCLQFSLFRFRLTFLQAVGIDRWYRFPQCTYVEQWILVQSIPIGHKSQINSSCLHFSLFRFRLTFLPAVWIDRWHRFNHRSIPTGEARVSMQ